LKKEIQIVLTLFFLPKIRKQLHVKPELEIKLFLYAWLSFSTLGSYPVFEKI